MSTVVFVHMPKGGGNSQRFGIESGFDLSTRCVVGGHHSPPDPHGWQDLSPDQLKAVQFAWAHWPFGFYVKQIAKESDTVWITDVRDPVDRALSEYHDFKSRPEYAIPGWYHFWSQIFNKYEFKHVLDKAFIKGLPEEQAQQMYRRLNNTQTRMISGVDEIMPDSLGLNPNGSVIPLENYILSDDHCQLAIQNLDKYFSWVGFTHRINADFNTMSTHLGFSARMDGEGIIHNPTVSRLYESDYDAETIELIREWNKYDCEIYEWVKQNRDSVNTRPITNVSPDVFKD